MMKGKDFYSPLKGKFITLEGISGCGKTTLRKNLSSLLMRNGLQCLSTRLPFKSAYDDPIHPGKEGPDKEVMLWVLAHRAHVTSVIQPAIHQKYTVLSEGSLDDCYVYYQAMTRKKNLDLLKLWKNDEGETHSAISSPCIPDASLFLDIPIELSVERSPYWKKREISHLDWSLLNQFRNGYLELATICDHRIHVIDGSQTEEKVLEDAIALLEDLYCTEDASSQEM